MNSHTTTIDAFATTIEDEIEASRAQGRDFSIVVLSTLGRIAPEERRKLLEWGDLVIGNHAPEGARVAAWSDGHSCLVLLPGACAPDAEAIGGLFGEQLNRLPVYGLAPGGGWSWEALSFKDRPEAVQQLAGMIRGRPS